MIIDASTPEGQKTKVFNADGSEITLPIKSYDTVSQTAMCYQLDDNGKILMTDWQPDGKQMVRKPILAAHVLPGSYAEIDGKRV